MELSKLSEFLMKLTLPGALVLCVGVASLAYLLRGVLVELLMLGLFLLLIASLLRVLGG